MIFKVSKKLKGSCVLTTLNKAISAGMTISIEGNNLYAGDIKAAIREGVLISADKKYTQKVSKIKHDVVIVNQTEKVVVLDNFVLRPLASMSISKSDQNSPSIQTAKDNGLIKIISDEKVKAKTSSKKPIKEEKADYVVPKSGEDREVKPKAWDLRAQELKEAQPVPKSDNVVRIDEDEENEDVEFVEDKKKKTTKKKSKKKVAKKKKSKKKTTKKKEITKKSKKVKTIEPVGEQKVPKNVMDAAIELDSRGNPIAEKPSEILQHMVDELNAPKEVGFADKQQAQERYNKRNNTD